MMQTLGANRRSLLWCGFGITLLFGPVQVVVGADSRQPTTPEAVVLEYLELDAQGAKLTAEGRQQMQRLAVTPVYGEHVGGPQVTHVIKMHKIVNKKIHSDRAVVTVEYELLGDILNFAKFEKRKDKSKEDFEIVKKSDGWYIRTISALDLWPYMSWQAVISQIRVEQKTAKERSESLFSSREERERMRRYLKRSDETIRQITESAEQSDR